MDLSALANFLTFLWLISIMFHTGLSNSFQSLFDSLNNPAILLKCLVANYIVVPLIALLFLIFFHPNPMLSLGFLIAIVLAGAPFAPAIVKISKGDTSLATGLMLFLTLLSVPVAPILLALLYGFLTESQHIHLDSADILRVLFKGQLLPLCLGLAISSFWAPLKQKIIKPFKIMTNTLMGVAMILTLYTQYHVFAHFGSKAFSGMFALLISCMAVGWLFGGRDRLQIKSMILVTGTRNAAAALTIASQNFAGTEVPLSVLTYSFISFAGAVVMSILLSYWKNR